MGMTTNSDIPFAKSLVDYIFRWLGMQFVAGYREQNAPRRTPASNSAAAVKSTTSATVKEDNECTDSETTQDPGKTGSTSTPTGEKPSGTDAGSSSTLEATVRDSVTTSVSPDGIVSTTKVHTETAKSVLDQSNAALMGDAPACDGCGSITVRNGTCYKCLNCGNSMGCS
jgi:ribonucleoside-diphosphate reductase alpha chain